MATKAGCCAPQRNLQDSHRQASKPYVPEPWQNRDYGNDKHKKENSAHLLRPYATANKLKEKQRYHQKGDSAIV